MILRKVHFVHHFIEKFDKLFLQSSTAIHIEFSFIFFDKINDKQNGQPMSTNRFNCLNEVLIELTIELHITLL